MVRNGAVVLDYCSDSGKKSEAANASSGSGLTFTDIITCLDVLKEAS